MSLTKEDLQAIKAIIKEETDTINQRLDKMDNRLDKVDNRLDKIENDITEMKSDIEDIKEYAEITRVSANASTEWLRKWSGKDKPFPVENDSFDDDEDIM